MVVGYRRSPFLYLVCAEFDDAHRETAWNEWYDGTHEPGLLSPGFNSATRYVECGSPSRYLAVYGVESPGVFDHPRYAEVCGCGPWEESIGRWRRGLYRALDTRHEGATPPHSQSAR